MTASDSGGRETSQLGLNGPPAPRLPGNNPAPSIEVHFNLQAARAAQEAARYDAARVFCLYLAGLAATAAFLTEMRSYFVFGDWLRTQEWTDHETLRSFLEWIAGAFPIYFLVFGFLGIVSMFLEDTLARICRLIFLCLAVPMLLLPILREERWRLIFIGAFICIYFISRWLSSWAGNQRPRDWKTILAARRRSGWGPEEFAIALTEGRASDGNHLATIVPLRGHLPVPENIEEKVDNVMRRGAYGQLQAVLPPRYEPFITLLRLRSKQRFPRALKPVELLERDGVSTEELELLAGSLLYVHPEVAERAKSLIGE
jgi:hypothetical protein